MSYESVINALEKGDIIRVNDSDSMVVERNYDDGVGVDLKAEMGEQLYVVFKEQHGDEEILFAEQDNRTGDLSHYEVVESIKLIGRI